LVVAQERGAPEAKKKWVENNMNVFDKILGLRWPDDITKTTWWADSVFRELEERRSNEQDIDSEVATAATEQTSELTGGP
jgi:hypothetical protein